MNEEMKKKNSPAKTCILMSFAVPGSMNNVGVVRLPCPQTSKSNIITNLTGCPDYDDIKGECKWILARDAVIEMASRKNIIGLN